MKKIFAFLFAVPVLLVATPGHGADVALSPGSIALVLSAGESGSVVISGALNNAPPTPYNIVLQLRSMQGTLPQPWMASPTVVLRAPTRSVLLPLTISVPRGTARGVYTAVLQPGVVTSNVPLAPTTRPIMVTVTVAEQCSAVPEVSVTSLDPSEFKAPNNRMAEVSLAGRIVVPSGCLLSRAWFVLADEYGVYGKTEDLTVAEGGAFSFAVPVMVSRNGQDKDGRIYQVTVFARDEAGVGASAIQTITVEHDQRDGK